MKFLTVILAAVVTLPALTNSLNLGLNLGLGLGGSSSSGLVNGLQNLIPNINLGVRVDLLISPWTVFNILTRPFDSLHALTDCSSHGLVPNVTLGRNGVSTGDKKWYQGANKTFWYAPVVIDTRFTQSEKDVIYAGMVEIQQKTCMKFYVYNTESDLQGFDYIKIMRGSGQGCYSDSIGRAHKGKQIVNLQPMEPSGCIIAGIAAHELLHAIGFNHQQCTPGRNDYVTIMYNNIQTGAKHNFDEDSASTSTSFGAPYDYGSIMHYGATAFSTNGQRTIVVKQSGAQIGQRKALSQWDAFKVNKMHGCSV